MKGAAIRARPTDGADARPDMGDYRIHGGNADRLDIAAMRPIARADQHVLTIG